jgi:hypothetical protein
MGSRTRPLSLRALFSRIAGARSAIRRVSSLRWASKPSVSSAAPVKRSGWIRMARAMEGVGAGLERWRESEGAAEESAH